MIGKRLKEIRLTKKISQQELGDIVGVNKVSICGYENGTRIPSLDTLTKLADTLHLSIDYLLGRDVYVIDEVTNEYVGSISEKDIEIIQEIKHYPHLYNKITKDVKRTINIINKSQNR